MSAQQSPPVWLTKLGDDGTMLPSYLTVSDVLNHPRYATARDHYIQLLVGSYYHDPAIRHLMHDLARNVLFNIILGYDALRNEDDPSTWPGVGKIRDIFLAFELTSPRSFDQMLSRMEMIGLVTITSAPDDKRRRIIAPTEKMIVEDLSWLARHMSPLAVLQPESREYQPALDHDRRYQRAQRIISTRNYATAKNILNPDDKIQSLLLKQGGAHIILIYLQAALEAGTPDQAALPFETAGLRAGVSLTHVRNFLTALQKFGLVRIGDGTGSTSIVLEPPLWHMMNQFLAASMSGHDLVWKLACTLVSDGKRKLIL